MSGVNELFDRLVTLQAEKSLPPVALWHPDREGTIDIRIAADGSWYHEGDPILRQSLVKLFSTILRREGDHHYLVTPAEKLRITVEDAPFLAVDFEIQGTGRAQQLLFITNVEDYVLVDADHPIRIGGDEAKPKPYLTVRDGLEALISRAAYYRLADYCEPDGAEYWLWSADQRFRVG